MARWTGNGVADGTALTSGNANTAGNGDTMTRTASGTPTWVFAGDGFSVTTATSTNLAQMSGAYTASKSGTAQLFFTLAALPVGAATRIIEIRAGSTTIGAMNITAGGDIQLIRGSGGVEVTGPVMSTGHRYQIDFIVNLSASPTTSNGRIVLRVKNLGNVSWNTTGDYFYDSGYATNVGTADVTGARFGKMSSGETLPSPNVWEQLGWGPLTVNPADTSRAAIESYFMASPYAASTVTGSASLTGDGSAVAAGTRKTTGTASLTGNGTVTATGTRRAGGTASLSGDGTVSGLGVRSAAGSASLVVNGTVTATGTITATTVTGAASLTGNGTVTATGTRRITGTAVLVGAATLSTTGTRKRNGTTTLTGNGAATATGLRRTRGTVALVGNGTVTSAGTRKVAGTATLLGGVLLTTNGRVTVTGAATLAGEAVLTVVGDGRIITPTDEERIHAVAHEVRAYHVPAEPRSWLVPAENRTHVTT